MEMVKITCKLKFFSRSCMKKPWLDGEKAGKMRGERK